MWSHGPRKGNSNCSSPLGGSLWGQALGGEPAGESDLVRAYGVIAAMPVSSPLSPERIFAWV